MFLSAGLMGAGAGLLGALLQGGLSAGVGLYGASQQADTADANRREAARQFDANMAWNREVLDRYEQMSNTAHQREVKDLIAAGLNPVLSATGGSGASSAMGPGGVAPTAHASDLDMSGSLGLVQRALSDAADASQKAMDFYSMSGLREAQSAEALSNASKNRSLTPAMKEELLQRANSAAASANFHNTMATQADTLTPLQGALLRQQTAKEQASAAGMRINNKWIDRKNQYYMMTEAAKRDYMAGQLKVNQVNAARGVYNSVRDTLLRPRGFRMENGGSSTDFMGDIIFNR